MANNRKSIREHEMSGTYRKDRHEGKKEIEWTRLAEAPPAPDYFDQYAIEAWALVTNELAERNDLCTVYLGQIEQYCYCLSLAKRATDYLNDALTTPSKANPAVSPYFRIYSQACKTVMDIGDKFGFNSKARMNMPGNEGSGKINSQPDWNPITIKKKFNMKDPEQKAEYDAMCADFDKMYPMWLIK